MIVSRSVYLDSLKSRVSQEERGDLESSNIVLISSYNRETVLRMLHDGGSGTGTVDTDQADALEKALGAYLAQYMAEYPPGHKWVILSCLYLSQIAGEPMHPQRMTGWYKEKGVYYCRAREEQTGSVCRWCICQRADSC